MTLVSNDTRRAGGTALLARLADLRTGLAYRAAQHRLYRSTKSQLEMLSDRELADINIHRSMIPEIAAEAAYES